ncbi:pro-adrenomedullin [Rhineura floridana]|uniref:pro-adrenomedullin n=1 Tax=Rhineura floridana TaxID=261503 RepID=UPI002AC85EA8|nr:pro-adrenomedullin [Rhineura floridana]
MKVVSVALFYLGSISFFGVEAVKLDVASSFKKKWSSALRRARRDESAPLTATQATAGMKRPTRSLDTLEESVLFTAIQAAAGMKRPLVRSLDVKGELGNAQLSRREDAHIRVKRYRQSFNSFPHLHINRAIGGCKFGTCTVTNLAHQLYHFTDKDKDGSAPPGKISPHGYGRRRR